jgi:hypothetical protein
VIDIQTEQDMSIEPGHQWLIIPVIGGAYLARLLVGTGASEYCDAITGTYRIPHTAEVDEQIVALINTLAHVRFSAPGLVQLTMEEAVGGQRSAISGQQSAVGGEDA